jgi:GNAT superfamily N-acetyltransferase
MVGIFGDMDRAQTQAAAHRRVVLTWLEGWAKSRGVPPPVEDGVAFRVDVGQADQRARLVFPELGPTVGERARAIEEPFVFLKVCAPLEAVRPMLPSRWTLQAPSFMMTRPTRTPVLTRPLAEGYRLEVEEAEAAARVAITAPDGALAAKGRLAVVGSSAVYDQIVTDAAHRRRGLGRQVMAALDDVGRRRGASEGLLVATPEGRVLYEAIGWRHYSPYVSAVISASL